MQERSQRTFRAILEGATHVLAYRGWPEFNTNTIAAKAGVSVASVYQYFYDKDAVLKQLVTDLIARDHGELMRYSTDVGQTGDFDDLIGFAISLHSFKPLLRQKIVKFNLALADERLITAVLSDYETIVLACIERDHHHIQHKPIASSLVVQSVMWSCNGFLVKDPHFYRNPVIVDSILKMARNCLSS